MDEMQSSKCPKLHRARPLSTIAGSFPLFSDEQQTISDRPRHYPPSSVG
jgi:hypothetical protein